MKLKPKAASKGFVGLKDGPQTGRLLAHDKRPVLRGPRQADAMTETSRRLKQLSHRLLEIQESERRHLARELHDEIGQTLTALKITLQGLKQFPVPATWPLRLDQAIGFVDHLLQGVRKLSLNLRPPMLDDLGLVPGLQWLLTQEARAAGLRVRLDSRGVDFRMEADVETACFRVAQEALTNVVRHARARNVRVVLRPEAGGLQLIVRDDGKGFDVAAAQHRMAQGASLGLISMEERAALAGGKLEVISARGSGTEVRAWFPTDKRPGEP
jgi:signal transduction histidine kinase